MTKDLSYFMGATEEEIVKFHSPDKKKCRDKDGTLIMLEARRLKAKRIQEISERCNEKHIALDKRKKPIINNGEVVCENKRDLQGIVNHALVAALVCPDLKDKALMENFGCVDVSQMPTNVFLGNYEYEYVVGEVFLVLGIIGGDDEENKVEEAKN